MASPIAAITKNFALAVRDMRNAQKEFFKSKDKSQKEQFLKQSIAAEKKVHDMLTSIFTTIDKLQ